MKLSKSVIDAQKQLNKDYGVTTYDTSGRVTQYGDTVNVGAMPSPETHQLSDEEHGSVLLSNKKIKTHQLEIKDIDLKLADISKRKDELKMIERFKSSNFKENLQIKTTSNSAYRELQSTESELIDRKVELGRKINIQQQNINSIGLSGQAGQAFSGGISMDPVMDDNKISTNVTPLPAMSPSERAQYFGKEDTLMNPNLTLEDVAQGLTEQGKSYLGGDSTVLDRAIASPVLDLRDSITNPEQYQTNLDYGYTNMNNSAKEISKNPAKFAGNVIAEGAMAVAPVGMVLGSVGKGGKIFSKISKPLTNKEINNVEKITMQAELGKLNPDPKIAKTVKLEIKSNDILSDTKPIEKIKPEIATLYQKDVLKITRLPTKAERKANYRKVLDKVEKDLGTSIFTGYTKKNADKYTGIGLIGGFGLTQNEKKNNFKY